MLTTKNIFEGDTVVIASSRNKISNTMKYLFPEHILKANLVNIYQDLVELDQITLMQGGIGPRGRNLKFLARSKLCNKDNIQLSPYPILKYNNNLYFDIYFYKININIYKEFQSKKNNPPSLFAMCFYQLSTKEILLLRTHFVLF